MKFSKLEQRIKDQATKYYTDGSNDVSDEEFDAMVDQLRAENPESEVLTTGWGYDPATNTSGEKVAHRYGEVGSLDKCHNWAELSKPMQGSLAANEVIASLKLDGISVVLYYRSGVLVQAVTRGDGHIGIDITDKIIAIDPELRSISDSFTGAVRGEILMSFDQFDRYRSIHPEVANPRNLTAGIIGRNEVTDDLNYLSVVVYRIIGDECEGGPASYAGILAWLELQFNHVVPYGRVVCEGDADLQLVMQNCRTAWYGKYPADGIVLTKSDTCFGDVQYEIVYTSQAFKFPAESKPATVKYVDWGMSKTQYAIPRVAVEPVELSGTTVEWATGFNAKFIQDNQIGPGAVIQLTKSGEIIPHILQVLEPADELDIPNTCPVCGEPLHWSGVHLKCNNSACGNSKQADLSIWMETLAPTDGLKDAIKFKFLNELYSERPWTVETFMHAAPLPQGFIQGAQKQLFATMWDTLHNPSVKFPLATVLKALNIPRISDVTANKLAADPQLIRDIFMYDYFEHESDPNYCEVIGNYFKEVAAVVGPASAESLYHNMAKLRRLALLLEVEDRIIWEVDSKQCRKVAVTGKLSVKRDQFERELKAAGFVITDVSKDTEYLITDDPNSNSSKNQKATKLGVPKVSESEFRAMHLS